MKISLLIGILSLSTTTLCSHCDKVLYYDEVYGYGYDITCQGITNQDLVLLEDIAISNEKSLTIDNCTFSDVSPKLFTNVVNIRKLIISNSTFPIKRRSVFEKLQQLKELSILQTHVHVNRITFEGLDELNLLEMDQNNLEAFEEGSFSMLASLQSLKISNNNVKYIKDIPLCELKNLQSFNLERNYISTLKNFNFNCRQRQESLEVNVNNNDLNVNIPHQDYINTSQSDSFLTDINLSYNNISDIGSSLQELDLLRHLNLAGNQLQIIRPLTLNTLRELETLILSNNKIKFIDDKVFLDKPNLRKLDLENNLITTINLNSTSTLEYLNLANNKLVLDSLSILSNLKLLKELILDNNKIQEILPNEFRNFSSLEILKLSGNNLTLNNYSFVDLTRLQELILSNNKIQNLPPRLFKFTTNLTKLDLSYNHIENLPFDIFYSLTNLKELNMSYNMLKDLQYIIFKPLKSLNVLDIAGNRLKNIQYEIIMNNLPSLSVINFKYNMLSCEFLYKVITFFKKKAVTYNINEQFEYEKENVEGIYCNEEKSRTSDGVVANHLISESSGVSVWAILLIVSSSVIVIVFSSYKLALYYKRRRYTGDEFELIHG